MAKQHATEFEKIINAGKLKTIYLFEDRHVMSISTKVAYGKTHKAN